MSAIKIPCHPRLKKVLQFQYDKNSKDYQKKVSFLCVTVKRGFLFFVDVKNI